MCNTSLTFFYHLLFDTSLFYYGWKLYYSVPLFQMWYVLFEHQLSSMRKMSAEIWKYLFFVIFYLGNGWEFTTAYK